MRKIRCDCCDKEMEDYIEYVNYPYWTEYLIDGYHTTYVTLLLCRECYPDVKSGKKKPKPFDQIFDIAWITGYE